LDFFVGGRVVVEVKAVEAIHPILVAQVLTYLKLSERSVGLLVNLDVPLLKTGIKRLVMDAEHFGRIEPQ
jgi:GxxExxY protein